MPFVVLKIVLTFFFLKHNQSDFFPLVLITIFTTSVPPSDFFEYKNKSIQVTESLTPPILILYTHVQQQKLSFCSVLFFSIF